MPLGCVKLETLDYIQLVSGAVVVTNSSPIEKLKDGLLSIPSQEVVAELGGGEHESTVSITVVGASGDLAKKKIFPANRSFLSFWCDSYVELNVCGKLLFVIFFNSILQYTAMQGVR